MHLGVCVGSGKIFLMLMYEDSRRTSLQEFGTRGRGEGGSLAPLQSRTNHILPFDAEIWLEFLSQQISSYEF